MLQVDADLVGLAHALLEAAVEIHRRTGLAIVDHRPIVIELHAAQVVDAKPQTETVGAGLDRLARVVVVDRQQGVIRRSPLEGDAAIDALIASPAIARRRTAAATSRRWSCRRRRDPPDRRRS